MSTVNQFVYVVQVRNAEGGFDDVSDAFETGEEAEAELERLLADEGHREMTIAHVLVPAQSLEIIKGILRCAGPAFSGGTDSETQRIAEEWNELFEPEGVQAWINVGCFTASAASDLDDAGITPRMCSRAKTDIGYGPGCEIAYAFANGDVTLEQVRAAIN